MYRAPAQRTSDTRQRCLYCGRENVPGGQCGPCRILVPPAEGANLRPGGCARCPSPFLEATVLGPNDAVVFECKGCHSAFITASAWTAILDAVLAKEPLDVSHFQAPPPPGQIDLFKLVRCSVCRYEMERARFGASTKLVIDVCNAHGVWLDPTELPVLIEIVGGGDERGSREEIAAPEVDAKELALLEQLRIAEQAYDFNVSSSLELRMHRDPAQRAALGFLGRINAIRNELDNYRLERWAERQVRRQLKQ